MRRSYRVPNPKSQVNLYDWVRKVRVGIKINKTGSKITIKKRS